MDCQSHLHQIGLGVQQYFDNWGEQFFLHHPFEADVSSQIDDAESFAEIYWEDKIMPYVNPFRTPTTAIANGGSAGRRREDLPVPERHLARDARSSTPDGTGRRDHEPDELPDEFAAQPHHPIRYGRYTFPRFQQEIGSSNFVAFNERNAAVMDTDDPDGRASARTTTTSGWAPSTLDTTGSPGTGTGPRTCCTSTATPSRSRRPTPTSGCTRAASS